MKIKISKKEGDMDETMDFYNADPNKDIRYDRRVTSKGTVEKPTGPRGEEPREPPKKSASSIRGKLVPEANDVQGMAAPTKPVKESGDEPPWFIEKQERVRIADWMVIEANKSVNPQIQQTLRKYAELIRMGRITNN